MIYKVGFPILFILTLSSCFGEMSESTKKSFGDIIVNSQRNMADGEFKKAIGYIELHKLRNGEYPASLKELEYLNELDSSMYKAVEYIAMDSVYELNCIFPGITVKNKRTFVRLKYPDEFWEGLGCVKSNAK